MPLVLPVDLPTDDIVIVVPDDGGRVMVLIDPRVPFAVGADTIDRVREILHSPGDICARLAELVGGPAYALG